MSTPNTLTKEQRKAVDMLALDIDELDNKPRRLFSALRDFAKAFVVIPKKNFYAQKLHLKDIIDSIDQMEHYYYQIKGVPDYARDIFVSREKVLRKCKSEDNDNNNNNRPSVYYDQEKAINLLVKEITDNLIDL